jgi:tetratricopeptide (TPR) repeat protein
VVFKSRGFLAIVFPTLSRFLLILLFLIIFLFSSEGIAQTQGYYDSLAKAKSILNEGQISEALDLLEEMELAYPGDENIIRLSGQAIYWSKDFEKTKAYFTRSIDAYPSLQLVKLDYGRILFQLQSYREATSILKSYLISNPEDPEANTVLAQMNFWQGGSPKKSYDYLDKILKPFPENEAAIAVKSEIEKATAPKISVQVGNFSDSQPTRFSFLEGSFGLYQSALLQPEITASISAYQTDQLISFFTLRNTSAFIQTGTSVTLSAGYTASNSWEKGVGLYGIKLDQKIKSGFTLNLSAAKESYFYTLASLDQVITPTTLKASFGRDYGGNFSGRLWIQNATFQDDNSVNAFGAWFLYPVLKLPLVRFEFGYAYTHGDSKEVRFGPNPPIQGRVNNTDLGTIIPGSYRPYFTPINQQIHGLLGKFTFTPSASIKLDASANIGVKATIDNPNMIYYGIGNSPGNRPIVENDLFLILNPLSYTPWDLAFNFEWELSPYSALRFSYAHQTTVFFNSNSLNLKFSKRLKR